MIIGTGAMMFALVFACIIVLSVIQQQRFAPWIGLSGILLFGYLALSLMLERDFLLLYRIVNGYVVLFFAVMLSVAGAVGMLARLVNSR